MFFKDNNYLHDYYVKLMLDFCAGDKSAFEKILKKYFPLIVNYIYKYVHNVETAEDIAQEVFIKIYQNAAEYYPKSKLSTWIYKIASNMAINELRRRKKIISLNADIGDDMLRTSFLDALKDNKNFSPKDDLLRKERNLIVKQAIDKLPKNQKEALILRRFEGMSYREIAFIMNITEKAVKSLLNRSKKNLYKYLRNKF